MNKNVLGTASMLVALGVLGCDTPSQGVQILGITPNSEEIDFAVGPPYEIKCTYEAADDEFSIGQVMDTGFSYRYGVPFTVRNNLILGEVEPANANSEYILAPRADVSPLRMDIRWECDSNGFSANVGPLVIPAFDPELPFCLETRADANESFRGFDVVPASGQVIGPGELGISNAVIVPFSMGQAIDETWRIARLADQCCTETAGTMCDGQGDPTGPCGQLAEIFATLDPSGTRLSVAATPGPSEDLVRFKAFSIFDGNYACQVDPTLCGNSSFGARYPMRIRGVMEFIKSDGKLVTSNEYADTIEFCRDCGQTSGPGATTRYPFFTDHTICYSAF